MQLMTAERRTSLSEEPLVGYLIQSGKPEIIYIQFTLKGVLQVVFINIYVTTIKNKRP